MTGPGPVIGSDRPRLLRPSRSRSAGLTPRGRALAAAALILAVSAGLFGIEELYALAAGAMAALITAVGWVSLAHWQLESERRLRPSRVSAGETATVELVVRNLRRRRSPAVAVLDPFDGGRRFAALRVDPVEPGGTVRASYRLATATRGMFEVGPLSLELSDPFGLARARRRGASTSSLTVYPKVEAIVSLPSGARSDLDTAHGAPLLALQGEEFYALREYRPGDDLRRIHWTATARMDEVLVRQGETMRRGRLTVAVDLRRPPAHLTIDRLLEAAASLVVAGVNRHLAVRLVTTDGTDTSFGSGRGQEAVLLDVLALAKQHARQPLPALLPTLGSGPSAGGVVLVTTDEADDADLAGTARLIPRQALTTVVFQQAGGRPLPLLPGRVVRVAEDSGFAEAWDAVILAAPVRTVR